MTDPLRPNPLGLPLDPDPTPSVDAPGIEGPDPVDDPGQWPSDRPEAPDPTGGSLDLPGEPPDGPLPRTDRPDPRIT